MSPEIIDIYLMLLKEGFSVHEQWTSVTNEDHIYIEFVSPNIYPYKVRLTPNV